MLQELVEAGYVRAGPDGMVSVSKQGAVFLLMKATRSILNARGIRNKEEWEYEFSPPEVKYLHIWKDKNRKEKDHRRIELTDTEKNVVKDYLSILASGNEPSSSQSPPAPPLP